MTETKSDEGYADHDIQLEECDSYAYVVAGQTFNADYYCWFLKHHLCPALWHKHPCLLLNNLPILFHYNAPCHIRNNATLLFWWSSMKHPPYLLDMNPCDLDLFLKLKEFLWYCLFYDFHLYSMQKSAFHHWHQQSSPW